MTEFLSFWSHPTTLVFLIGSAALLVTWRMSNQKISLTWESKTVAPEPSKHSVAVLTGQRDEAREQAVLLRDELARKP